MLVELHNIYRLANGMFVIAVEDRGTHMLTTKIGEVPGYHHNYDGTHIDHGKPDMEVDEFRVVSHVVMIENGTLGNEEVFK